MRPAPERGPRGDRERHALWRALFRDPERLEQLRADRSLLPSAIEELLRYQTPLPMFERWVLEPFELHASRSPRSRARPFDSANRDPLEIFILDEFAPNGDPTRI